MLSCSAEGVQENIGETNCIKNDKVMIVCRNCSRTGKHRGKS